MRTCWGFRNSKS